MKFLKEILIIALLMLSAYAGAQYRTKSNKALRSYIEGKEAYEFFKFEEAEVSLGQAVEQDPYFIDALMLLGQLYSDMGKYPESVKYYRKGIAIDSLYFTPAFYTLARAEMMCGNYSEALESLKRYILSGPGSDELRKKAEKAIIDCEFSMEAIKNPVDFNPENLGPAVNSQFDEYWPSISADGQTLIFTRQLEYQRGGGHINTVKNEDFFISRLNNGAWAQATNAGRPLNSDNNEGAQTLSSDGSYMYFTACSRYDSYGRCDIYFSSFSGTSWTEPKNIGSPVNGPYWDAQPSVTADGKTLYFVSNRPGGLGGMDLWVSRLEGEGKWSEPSNLGDMINTPGDEMSPFIHFDGKTLYFSSNGRPSLGGHDIYFTRYLGNGLWQEPLNLGYPINTNNDEMGLIIDARGERAYYSSVRDIKRGKDLFSFKMPQELRPEVVSYMKGKVFDKITGRLLVASFEVSDLTNSSLTSSGQTDRNGSFLVCLNTGNNYAVNVSKSGYLFYSENIRLEGEFSEPEPFIKDIYLSPLTVGEKMSLYNIFFETDSWEIQKASTGELDKLYTLLKENPGLKVEIGGHTDSTGADSYNLQLSDKRALAVLKYLTERGIAANRLTYKGYGKDSPISENDSSEGRRLNRRTEIAITAVK